MMDTGQPFNPLSKGDYQRIHAALAETARAGPYLAKLAQLGHAVDSHSETIASAVQYLRSVLQAFPEDDQS